MRKHNSKNSTDYERNERELLNILVIVGSLRKESTTLKMANFLLTLVPTYLNLEIIKIGDLPLYNEDLETDHPPIEWVEFRKRIKKGDGILFLTPEYNRSVPAALKNAIDVGSAPHGYNVFDAKPTAIISLSTGSLGAFGANHHLRQSLVFLNMPAMQQPEAYIGESESVFNKEGKLIKDSTRGFLIKFMNSFELWIRQNIND
ncbi:NADPH-dependent FMN reductase [Mucilaginibacter polytrichastri]|uniref:NADPH:quinone oxidoreductase n=1 Tax=Mucilaginibacter polytrichastri TaxID=1302689 RepID=A0A1Q5ZWM7_9SPHI|nr:NAD(P)H-dependent oxidoreductase [Mucilaginibacter polytrichastri]OKS86146.1 NADPH:quinone oxidoreductase [Mucilaginibacter polytrichastri]SFT15328.1 NAD(P)H-dependent FMN reductase [Mucilaginibacter polytrichastri]